MHAPLTSTHMDVCQRFTAFMTNAGLTYLPPEAVIPEKDPSLLFTNATTVLFKPYFLQRERIVSGAFTIQPCLRFQSLKAYEADPRGTQHYNLYFNMLGGFVSVESTIKPFRLLYDMLLAAFALPAENIELHLERSSKELFEGLESIEASPILYDQERYKFYNWSYGLDDVKGRGLSYVYRMRDGRKENLGQVIAVFNGSDLVGYEFGFGVETLIYADTCAESVLSCSEQMPAFPKESYSPAQKQVIDIVMAMAIILDCKPSVYDSNERQGSLFHRLVRHIVRLSLEQEVSDMFIEEALERISGHVRLSLQTRDALKTLIFKKVSEYQSNAALAEELVETLKDDIRNRTSGKVKASNKLQTFFLRNPTLPEKQEQLMSALNNV